MKVYGITNQLRLPHRLVILPPVTEAAITLAASVFLRDDGPKKNVPFVLAVTDYRK